MFFHQRYYDLAIGMCLEVVWVLQSLTNESVIVYFAIDSKSKALIAVGKWLSSGIDTDNG